MAVGPNSWEFGYGNFNGNFGPVVLPLLFHCDGPEDVIITFRDGTYFGGSVTYTFEFIPFESSLTIHQPEPMMLSLLGLGGLALLRRRRLTGCA